MSICIIKTKLLLSFLLVPLFAFSQQKTDQSQRDTIKHFNDSTDIEKKDIKKDPINRNDTIYLFGGEQMHVNVLKITYENIIYREPGETNLQNLDKDKVHKIRYNWGRLEMINETKPKERKRYNWRKVKILSNKKETEGLY